MSETSPTVAVSAPVKPSTQAANTLKRVAVLYLAGPSKVKTGKNRNPKGTPAYVSAQLVAAQARIDAKNEWIAEVTDGLADVCSLVDDNADSARWSITSGGTTRSLVAVLDAMQGTSLQAQPAFAFAATLGE